MYIFPGFTEERAPQAVSNMSRIRAPREERQSDDKQPLHKDPWTMTLAVLVPRARLHSKLAGSSRGTDPEATEAGSAKVPLCEQRQSNRLMGYMIAEKGKEK